MQAKHNIALLIAICVSGLLAPAQVRPTDDATTHMRTDSVAPEIILSDEAPLLRQAAGEEAIHGPIVDRRYKMGCRFLTLPDKSTDLFIVYNLTGTAEYADGFKLEESKTHNGALSIGNLLQYTCMGSDPTYGYVRDLSSYRSPVLPSEENPNYLLTSTKEFEFTDEVYYRSRSYGCENPYMMMRGLSSGNLHVATYTKASYFMWMGNSANDLSILTDYFRERMLATGEDPENFESMLGGWNPTCVLEIEGVDYEGSTYPFLTACLEFGLFGKLYAEGGLGENCTLMVVSEPPAEPTGTVNVTHLGKTGRYMDAWEVTSTLKTSQYGVSYTMTCRDRYYLSYPADDEMKEAARAAGYDVP